MIVLNEEQEPKEVRVEDVHLVLAGESITSMLHYQGILICDHNEMFTSLEKILPEIGEKFVELRFNITNSN